MLAAQQKPDSARSPALDAILALAANNAPTAFDNDDATARQLLAQLRWHRVGLRLQKQAASLLPPPLRQRFELDCQSALKKTAANIQSLLRITRCLDDKGIPYLTLKGPALAQLLYGSALIKESGDIDILVKAEHAAAAIAALEAIGMTSNDSMPTNPQTWKTIQLLGKDWIFDDKTTGAHVELHWRVEINPYLLPTRFDDWFARKSRINIGGADINSLCLQDLFIQVMVHGARSTWSRLHWLMDFDALLRRDDIDWHQARADVIADDLQQILLYSWQLSHKLLATPLPQPLSELVEQASSRQQRRADDLVSKSLLAMQQRKHITWLPLRIFYLQLKQKLRFQLFELITLIGPYQPDVMKLPLPIYLYPVYFLLRPWFVIQRRLSEH